MIDKFDKFEKFENFVKVEMATISENVSLARIIATGFIAPLDPTVDESSDIKTAVSEAVTNAIIHGYEETTGGIVEMKLFSHGRKIVIEITDSGVGIHNIEEVREPMFTTKPDMERSGLGFTVMETFMDTVEVESQPGKGTTVILTKTLKEVLA